MNPIMKYLLSTFLLIIMFNTRGIGQSGVLIDSIQQAFTDNDLPKTDSLIKVAMGLYRDSTELICRVYLEKSTLAQVTMKPADAIIDVDSTISFVEKRIKKDDPLWGEIYNLKGVLLLNDGKNDGAIYYLRKGIELLKAQQDTSETIFESQGYLARALFLLGEFEESIKEGESALNIMLVKYDTLEIPNPIIFKSLSNTYTYINNYEKAEEYARLFLKHMQNTYPGTHLNIGVAHTDIALVNIYMEKYEEALSEYEKARKIFYEHHLETGSNVYLGYIFQVMSQVYDRMGELDLALEYSRKGLALKLTEYDSNNLTLFGNYDVIADYLIKLGRLDEAEEVINTNYRILRANNVPFNYQHQSLNRSLAQIYDEKGDFNQAENLFLKNIRYIESEGREISMHAFNNKLGLTRIYINQNKLEEALTLLPEIKLIVDSLEGQYSKSYGEYIYSLAAAKNKNGEHNEAYRIISDHLKLLDLNKNDNSNYNLPQIEEIEDLLHLMLIIIRDSFDSGENPLPLSEIEKILNTVDLFISQKIVTYRNSLSYQSEGTFLRNVYGQS